MEILTLFRSSSPHDERPVAFRLFLDILLIVMCPKAVADFVGKCDGRLIHSPLGLVVFKSDKPRVPVATANSAHTCQACSPIVKVTIGEHIGQAKVSEVPRAIKVLQELSALLGAVLRTVADITQTEHHLNNKVMFYLSFVLRTNLFSNYLFYTAQALSCKLVEFFYKA